MRNMEALADFFNTIFFLSELIISLFLLNQPTNSVNAHSISDWYSLIASLIIQLLASSAFNLILNT